MQKITENQHREFYASFVQAMLWASGGDNDLIDFDLAAVTRDNLRIHCEKWANDNVGLLAQYESRINHADASAWVHAGHDFFLTAAGHGAGFFDHGLGVLGDALTEASDGHGVEPYVGDDGLVYVCGMETLNNDNNDKA